MARPVKERSPIERAELEGFAKRLTEHMARAGMSQSDLARAVWGTTQDARGQDVARNRDRISHYVRGSQLPEPKTMRAVANALGCEVADLNPALTLPAGGRSQPETAFTSIAGRPDVALITINKVLPTKLAVQILALIAKAEEEESKKGAA